MSICLVSIFFLFSGCSRPHKIAFFLKQYTALSFSENKQETEKVSEFCTKADFYVSVKSIENDTPSIFNQLIKNSGASVIYLDPLFALPPSSIAEASPDILFLATRRGHKFEETGADNLLVIQYDRNFLMEKVGSACGMLLTYPPVMLKNEFNTRSIPKLGVIDYVPLYDSAVEIEQLESAFIAVAGEYSFVYNEIKKIDDPGDIRSVVSDLYDQGVRIFYLRSGSLNTVFLDSIRTFNAFAIVEDWESFMGYSDIVLFGLSEDLPSAINSALSDFIGKQHKLSWKAKLVKIPWRINIGKAVNLPGPIKTILK